MAFTNVIVNFVAKPGQRDAVTGMLSGAIEGTLSKPDCYKAELFLDADSDDKFFMLQLWTTADAHRAYVDGVMADPKMKPVMELLAGPPEVQYGALKAAAGGEWGGPQHLEISSLDTDATGAFLTEVFGWRFNEMMPGYDGFWAPGALFGGLRPKMDEEPAPQAIPYLVVNDLDERLASVEAAGGTITVPIQTIEGAGRFFWFIAPGGLQLAAWESAQP